jgi:hypothetical protein
MWSFSWLRNGKRSLSAERGGAQRSSRRRVSCRPRLDVLEDRCLPSGFSAPVNYPVGTNPQAVVTADVNGDGKLDLITANQGTYDSATGTYVGGGVSVLLGNGRGGFGAARNYAAASAVSLAVADCNGDGKLDMVTGSGSVLLGNGDGTFRTGPSYTGGLYSYVTAADLNGDGKLDLLTASYSVLNKNISVLLGNGDGTFRAGPTYATPTYLRAVTLGDFNGDGKPDIIAATNLAVSLLPGNGDGTFGAAQQVISFASGESVLAVTAADFNADGKLDLAVMDEDSLGVSAWVLLGNGDGTFRDGGGGRFYENPTNPSSMTGPYLSTGLAAADINHDGKLDLITVDATGSNPLVGVLPGKGDGTFGLEQEFSTPTGSAVAASAFTVGDFNGDGYADLALVGSYGTGYDVSLLVWNPSSKKK